MEDLANMLKNAIESASDYFDSRKRKSCVKCDPKKLFLC